jgi:hypothetical protein
MKKVRLMPFILIGTRLPKSILGDCKLKLFIVMIFMPCGFNPGFSSLPLAICHQSFKGLILRVITLLVLPVDDHILLWAGLRSQCRDRRRHVGRGWDVAAA